MKSRDEKIHRLLFSCQDDESRDGLLYLYQGYGLKMFRFLRLRLPQEDPRVCSGIVYESFFELFEAILNGKLKKSDETLPISPLFELGLKKSWAKPESTAEISVDAFLDTLHTHPARRCDAEEFTVMKELPEFRDLLDQWISEHQEDVIEADADADAVEEVSPVEIAPPAVDMRNEHRELKQALVWLGALLLCGMALIGFFKMMGKSSTASQAGIDGNVADLVPAEGNADHLNHDFVLVKLDDDLYQFRRMLIPANSPEEAANKAVRFLEPDERSIEIKFEIEDIRENS